MPQAQDNLEVMRPFDPHSVKDDQTIFFWENDISSLSGRKLCSIESAARVNEDKELMVLINADLKDFKLPMSWLRNTKSNSMIASIVK